MNLLDKIKSIPFAVAFLLGIVLCFLVFWKAPIARDTLPGIFIRNLTGEPGAKLRVDADANKIVRKNWSPELEALCDNLLTEFLPQTNILPRSRFGGGYLLPAELVPGKFRRLGGLWGDPELILRSKEDKNGPLIILLWGNGRHNLIITPLETTFKLKSYYYRKISERVFVSANYS